MPDQGPATETYAMMYSESGKASRRDLPPEAMCTLFDILDALVANPDAFPGRVRAISRDGKVRLYSHPSPALQVTYEVDTDRRVLYLLHFVAPKVEVTKPVFISYSHKDAKWLMKLKQFLQPLEERELIRVWDDTEIRPGSEWIGEIHKALGSARVAMTTSALIMSARYASLSKRVSWRVCPALASTSMALSSCSEESGIFRVGMAL
jgi:hypothetical protein